MFGSGVHVWFSSIMVGAVSNGACLVPASVRLETAPTVSIVCPVRLERDLYGSSIAVVIHSLDLFTRLILSGAVGNCTYREHSLSGMVSNSG